MGSGTVRVATRADAEAILNVTTQAFSINNDSPRWKAVATAVQEQPERMLVLEQDHRVLGALHVHPSWLRVGVSTFLKGDVGDVAVLPEMQGRGLGTRLLEGCVAWMRQQGFDVGRLGGLLRFYRRFGWVPFPRRFYEFPLTPVRAGAVTLPAEARCDLAEERARHVRPYRPAQDAPFVQEIYDRFSSGRTGSVVGSAVSTTGGSEKTTETAFRLVYDQAGAVGGYLFARTSESGVPMGGVTLEVTDVAYDPTVPVALTTLVRTICRTALELGEAKVTMRLPFDPLVNQALVDDGIGFVLREVYDAPAGNMIAVINLASLLERLLPEMRRRLQGAALSWKGTVALAVGGERAMLHIDREQASVCAGEALDGSSTPRLQCDTGTWMKLVLGLYSFSDLEPCLQHTLPPDGLLAFQALFPRQPTASGPWG